MTGSGFGIGRIRWNWLAALVVLLAALPLVSETNTPTLLAIWALFALSLALMWGYAGILSFGHAAYFGLGAYTYAIASFNIGESTVPVLLALIVPALVAAIIGAMMFYGRISDVYLGVMTLVVTLILNRFMNATAGDAYRIGNARLGGFNGIPAFPTLNVPGRSQRGGLRDRLLLRGDRLPDRCLSDRPLDLSERVRANAYRHS